ncbi:unnamed protein product [Fusarium graminearum]|nr:unnamed protein product [Fusarium graminearum]VTO83345.1 unnamed protein product [Fusarium graminearum]
MAAGSSSNTLGQTYGSHIRTVEKRLITNADALPVWSIEALFHKNIKLQGQQSQPSYFLRFSQLPWRIKLYVFDKKRNIDNENNKYWL